MESQIKKIIAASNDIVIIQADNPDGDSLASALALEQILSDQGKKVHLYCGVTIPTYLRYIDGWDRVYDMLPVKFDASIIVDTSAVSLLEQLQKTESLGWVKSKPCIVIDHHTENEPTIDFSDVNYIQKAVSAGEVIYEISNKLSWNLNETSKDLIAISILSDSLGLISEGTSARSIEIISELVKTGVSLAKIDNKRRSLQKKSPELIKYKAELLNRVEYAAQNQIAHLTIPWEEIERYSLQYNPPMLVIDEMRMITDVKLAIAFKTYPDGRITAKLRANYGYGVAAELAEHFGGGGHSYAAGFKIVNSKNLEQVKKECFEQAEQLLVRLNKGKNDETIRYTHTVS